MVYHYDGLKGIHLFLDLLFHQHKNKDWDTVACICGDVGKGKSNLGLHMLEYWQKKLYNECNPSDVKHMCLDTNSFLKDLADCKKVEFTIYDEAGELSSRSAMSKLNKMIMVTYQIIRADRIFTLLVLPDIWYIDSYFRNTRIKHLFHINKRGHVAYWNTSKLKRLIALNETRQMKNYYIVEPCFTDTFPIYRGVMAEKYKELKENKTKEARKKLNEPDKKKQQKVYEYRDKIILNMKKLGYTNTKIGEAIMLHNSHVGKIIRDINKVSRV